MVGTPQVSKIRILSMSVALLMLAAATYIVFSFQTGVSRMRGEMESTRIAILKSEHECPKGAVESVERWGQWGYSRFCLKDGKENGKWVGWEKQHKVIEGNYRQGKKHGLWTWFDDEGRVTRTIQYVDGVDIGETTPSSKK